MVLAGWRAGGRHRAVGAAAWCCPEPGWVRSPAWPSAGTQEAEGTGRAVALSLLGVTKQHGEGPQVPGPRPTAPPTTERCRGHASLRGPILSEPRLALCVCGFYRLVSALSALLTLTPVLLLLRDGP